MIKGYLRYRWMVFALYLVVLAIFPGIAYLYGDDLSAASYGLLILTFLLAIVLVLDFARYVSRAKALDAVLDNLSEAAHALPAAAGPIEARYHELVSGLYELLEAQSEGLLRAHSEQVDYYTMWVHQIKTPIAAMRLALSGGTRPELLAEELFKVERYVEMALQFVKLSDLSSDLVLREYPLAPIVSASVKKYAPLFIGKRLKVEIEGVDNTVTTDSKWLSFILEQLLSNAVKYTEKGSVRVIGTAGTLMVEDTGIGIRQEDMARIFQKGYTGYNGRMDQRASGLGLYMAKRVADQLGIRMYPESTLGKGTRMTLIFPKRNTFVE